ncbi:MAG: 16S rRNA (uracil(1498)-N(3))-methyltransferase, partial [Muribaculaceae bacterium]|nr:16S rRNA (uracil(1498)-N(3))-methyltransferase [Muribaculaceae bacterium]
PEGDFSPEEVELAVANGFIPVTFGDSRLRTETAALYGVTAVHIINQMNK